MALRTLTLAVMILAALSATLALGGCEEPPPENIERVTISGRTFDLEISADNASRVKGLSGRTEIKPDGGMLFVFPRSEMRTFVMRDCPIPIDIIFLDGTGRITAMHKMTVEEPRKPGETDQAYETRLRKYSSAFAAQYAIELKGNTLDDLKLKNGDLIKLNVERLKKIVK